jgi:hypothetical protein
MPSEVLTYLARQYRLELEENMGREALVEFLLEFFDEIREEKEATNNLQVKGEEKKYVIARDEELEIIGSEDVSIPERYNETQITALVRDPSWAFAYWEIDDTKQKEIKKHGEQARLYLRVHDLSGSEDPERTAGAYIDIPVKWEDTRWYINLPHPGCSYIIELVCRNEGKPLVLARANRITTPRGSPSSSKIQTEADKLLALSSRDFCDPSPGSGSIPQRVLSI